MKLVTFYYVRYIIDFCTEILQNIYKYSRDTEATLEE